MMQSKGVSCVVTMPPRFIVGSSISEYQGKNGIIENVTLDDLIHGSPDKEVNVLLINTETKMVCASIPLKWLSDFKADRSCSIQKEMGAEMGFSGGEEAFTPMVDVVQSNYHRSEPGDKILRIRELGVAALYLSLATLKDIVAWAEKE